MPELISQSKSFGAGIQFDTVIPTLTDSADITEALKYFYFGRTDAGNLYESTSLYAHLVSLNSISGTVASLSEHPNLRNNTHGLGSLDGDIVGTTAEQTLTRKTLSSPTVNNPRINSTTTSVSVTSTEINHLLNINSNVQTQLNNKLGANDTAVNSSKIGGRTIFVQTTTPTALAVGDIWFQI